MGRLQKLLFAKRTAGVRGGALAAVTGFALALGVVSPAAAIINGKPDGNRHPNAGAMIFDGLPQCSGVLISPLYFATAGHCVQGARDAGVPASEITVTFAEKPGPASKYYQVASMTTHPNLYLGGQGDPAGIPHSTKNDYAVLKLTTSVSGITPANLPAIGAVDKLPTKTTVFQTVGYGASGWVNNEPVYPDVRNYVALKLSNGSASSVTPEYMKLGDNQSSACFGDSGGPTFLGSNIRTVYGLTSFGNFKCTSWVYSARLDTVSAKSFYRAYD